MFSLIALSSQGNQWDVLVIAKAIYVHMNFEHTAYGKTHMWTGEIRGNERTYVWDGCSFYWSSGYGIIEKKELCTASPVFGGNVWWKALLLLVQKERLPVNFNWLPALEENIKQMTASAV